MELKDLLEVQRHFDEKHGWIPKDKSPSALLHEIGMDTVGLLGELGEFANIVKKLQIDRQVSDEDGSVLLWQERKSSLDSELVDVFIYLMRLAVHLDVDLENGYFRKLQINEERFARYKRTS